MKIKFFATLISVFMLSIASLSAQSLKVGYTNIDFILGQIPDSKEIQTKLATEKQQYDKLIEEKITKFQTDVAAYQQNAASMSEVIRADKEKNLTNQQTEIQEFQKNSETALQAKYQQLLSPVMDKIQAAIDEVAKENGYNYVFNSDAGVGTTPIVLVAPEQDNITNLVLTKLGVEITEEAATE